MKKRKFKKTLGHKRASAPRFTRASSRCFTSTWTARLLFYVVEPFLKKHYDDMERRDILKQNYDIGKFPNTEYDVK